MKLIVKTDKHAAGLKRIKEMLSEVKTGIKNAQNENNEQLKKHGLDPSNLEKSLKSSTLSEPDKQRLWEQLSAAASACVAQGPAPASWKKPKPSSKRLNV